MPFWVTWSPLAVTVIGFAFAYYYYILHEGLAAKIAAQRGPLYLFFYNKWFFDELYDFVFVRGAKALGDIFWKDGDQRIIDGFGPNGVAFVWRCSDGGSARSRPATSTTTPSSCCSGSRAC